MAHDVWSIVHTVMNGDMIHTRVNLRKNNGDPCSSTMIMICMMVITVMIKKKQNQYYLENNDMTIRRKWRIIEDMMTIWQYGEDTKTIGRKRRIMKDNTVSWNELCTTSVDTEDKNNRLIKFYQYSRIITAFTVEVSKSVRKSCRL